MKKIVLTGAPHAGKTTIIEELARRGHKVVPESAITVINMLNNVLLGKDATKVWRKEHFRGFQGLVAGRQSWLEALSEEDDHDGPIFLDRGSFDGRAFARHYEKTTYLDELPVQDTKYDQVFLIKLILPFDSRSDSGRLETEEDCRWIEQHLFDVYNGLGLEPTIIPLLPIEERVDYLLERVK